MDVLSVLEEVVPRFCAQKLIVLSKFETEKHDARYHTKVREYSDGLADVDLLQFFTPRYATDRILTVNERLLPAEAGSKVEPKKIGGKTSPNTLASIPDVGGQIAI